MKKQALLRGLYGVPIGIAWGYGITILFSCLWGQGHYAPCMPQLAEAVGSESGAVLLQAVLCGVIGFSFAAGSVIWDMERWSIAKQTGLYFLITSLVMLPIAYLTNWMGHSVSGFLSYFGVFAALFAAAWLIQYLIWKKRIATVNSGIRSRREDGAQQ